MAVVDSYEGGQDTICEACKGQGYYGNNGPGVIGNSEWQRCDQCDADGTKCVEILLASRKEWMDKGRELEQRKLERHIAKDAPAGIGCTWCGSYAINQHLHGRTAGKMPNLCDVCYWRATAAEMVKGANK